MQPSARSASGQTREHPHASPHVGRILTPIGARVSSLKDGGTLVSGMSDRALPSFRNPPVTEVVVGLAFKPIVGLSVPRLGQLWSEKFADYFPQAEEQPPYEPPIERFDEGVQSELFRMQLIGGGFPRPRMWFLNERGDELVQIQRDYFACNWRKVHPDAEYGRWHSRRTAFERWLSAFQSFLANHSLGEILPTQCEVTYVNHIDADTVWSTHGDIASILRLVGTPPYAEEGFEGKFEQLQLVGQFRLQMEGIPFARLHATLQPGFRRLDNKPIYILDLTVRGRPLGEGADGVLAFLDEARKAIVSAFASLTTPAMHGRWGRDD
jgi:uncharacterized protein (TIGR04255 family)